MVGTTSGNLLTKNAFQGNFGGGAYDGFVAKKSILCRREMHLSCTPVIWGAAGKIRRLASL